jgi:uncharacterized protein
VEFEFDRVKSEANLRKHNIDFNEAQDLWEDQYAAVIDARSDSEPRSALIAYFAGRYGPHFLRNAPRRSD